MKSSRLWLISKIDDGRWALQHLKSWIEILFIFTGLSAIVHSRVAAGREGNDEQLRRVKEIIDGIVHHLLIYLLTNLATNSSPTRYVVFGELITGESLGGTATNKNTNDIF